MQSLVYQADSYGLGFLVFRGTNLYKILVNFMNFN